MREDIKLLWIDALTSGEYKQGVGRLINGDKFCCLGVLCDLHSKMTGEGKWDKAGWYITTTDRELTILPTDVRDWTGVDSGTGPFDNSSLACANDTGKSFLEIAEIIFEKF